MDVINACVLFLVKNTYYFIGAFVVYLVFIGQTIYYFFGLDRPEIKKKFTPLEIEMARRRIGGYLRGDIIIISILLLLVVLSLGLKLWFNIFHPLHF